MKLWPCKLQGRSCPFSAGKIAGVTQGHCSRLPWLSLWNNCGSVRTWIPLYSGIPDLRDNKNIFYVSRPSVWNEENSCNTWGHLWAQGVRVCSCYLLFLSRVCFDCFEFSLIYPSFTYLGLTYSVWLHSDSFSSMRLRGLMELKWEALSLLIEAFGNFVQLPDKDHNLPGPDRVIPGLPGLQSCVSHILSLGLCSSCTKESPSSLSYSLLGCFPFSLCVYGTPAPHSSLAQTSLPLTSLLQLPGAARFFHYMCLNLSLFTWACKDSDPGTAQGELCGSTSMGMFVGNTVKVVSLPSNFFFSCLLHYKNIVHNTYDLQNMC